MALHPPPHPTDPTDLSPKTWKPPTPHATFPPFYTLQPNTTTRTSQLKTWMTLLLSYSSHNRMFRISTSDPIFRNEKIKRSFAPEDVRVLFAFMRRAGRAEWVDSSGSGGGVDGGLSGGMGAESTSVGVDGITSASGYDDTFSTSNSNPTSTVPSTYPPTSTSASNTRNWLGRSSTNPSTSNPNSNPSNLDDVNPNETRDEIYIYFRTLEDWASEIYDWVEETGQRNAVLTAWEIVEGDSTRGKRWSGMPLPYLEKVLGVLVKRGKAVLFSGSSGSVGEGGVKFL